MKKVIWYLHHYAGAPSLGMSYRPYYLAKELNTLGFDCYVIGASFHHLSNRDTAQTESIKQERVDEVPYLWLKTPKYFGSGVGRLINMFVYSLRIWFSRKALVAATKKPDVIIVSSAHPIHYLSARLLARKYNAKLIFEVRDLWPLSLIQILGVSASHPLVWLIGWIERLAYNEANYVVSLLPNAFSYMKKKGLDANRFVYIPNGVSVASLPFDTESNEINQLKEQGKFIFAYIGAHGKPNALEQFIAALQLLQEKQQNHIHAIFLGKGEEKENLKQQACNLNNITFLESIPKDAVAGFLSNVDATFLGWRALPIYQYGISPNKIFDYMLAAKPIIHATDTPCDPVKEAQCGISVPAENPELLANALVKMASLPADEIQRMGVNGKNYVCEHHRYEILAKKYSELF